MFQTFKKLVKLNLDDLLLYLGVEGGLFLLIQIIIGCVMHFGRPDTSVTVACIVFPIVGGFTALVAGIAHVGISFDQALRFGQTRKRALGLILGLMSFQTAFALVLGGLLAAMERFLCVPLWAKLAGMNGWVMGSIMPVPEGTMVNGALVPEKTLIIETFTLDWYWWLLIFAGAAGSSGASVSSPCSCSRFSPGSWSPPLNWWSLCWPSSLWPVSSGPSGPCSTQRCGRREEGAACRPW